MDIHLFVKFPLLYSSARFVVGLSTQYLIFLVREVCRERRGID